MRERDRPFTYGGEVAKKKPRKIPWLLIIAIAIFAAGAYVYVFQRQALEVILPVPEPPTAERIYKWRDSSGETQMTDRPPKGDVPYEVIDL